MQETGDIKIIVCLKKSCVCERVAFVTVLDKNCNSNITVSGTDSYGHYSSQSNSGTTDDLLCLERSQFDVIYRVKDLGLFQSEAEFSSARVQCSVCHPRFIVFMFLKAN